MADIEKPITEVADRVVTNGEPVATESPAQTLSAAGVELRYFTPALLMTHGRFDRDPMYEFNSRQYDPDENLRPFGFDLDRPIFQGLSVTSLGNLRGGPYSPQVDWNHRLYAIHASRFEELCAFVCAISFKHTTGQQELCTVGSHALQAIDVTALGIAAAAAELPTIHLTVFCISSNFRFTYMQPATDPPRTRPYPFSQAPTPEAILQAKAVFGPPPDPQAIFRV